MRSHRSRRGSAIAELGPALFMFVVIIFFPLVDILGMGAQFACVWYHNHLMLQELPVRKKVDGNGPGQVNAGGRPVHNEVYARFTSTGLAKFSGADTIKDDVVYSDAAGGLPAMVSCVTTVDGHPFISLPFLGFTSTHFSVGGEATREVVER